MFGNKSKKIERQKEKEFTKLIKRWEKLLCAVIWKQDYNAQFFNKNDVESVFHETILKIYDLKKRYQREEKIIDDEKALFCDIARKTAVTELKKTPSYKERKNGLIVDEISNIQENTLIDDGGYSIDEDMRKRVDIVLICLPRLKESCREILELVFRYKLDGVEIGGVLGIGSNTARKRKERCLGKLKEIITSSSKENLSKSSSKSKSL